MPTISNVPQLQTLMRSTVIETYGHLYPRAALSDYLDTAFATDQLTTELVDPHVFWQLILDDGGAAVAYLQCQPAHLPHPDLRLHRDGQLERIYVLGSHQGRGLGHRLLDIALIHFADRYGDAPQWLAAYSENTRAHAIYRS